jgi:hypothetical protein
MKGRLAAYHRLCERFGALPRPRIVSADHGRKRYFVYRFALPLPAGPCVTPALSWVDAPAPGSGVRGVLEARGWAFKDGVGLRKVELRVDGRVAATAVYGEAMPRVAGYWRISTDPHHPNVGWRARVDLGGLAPGTHWLGLRLHGADGSVEDSAEQPFVLAPR